MDNDNIASLRLTRLLTTYCLCRGDPTRGIDEVFCIPRYDGAATDDELANSGV